MCPQPLQPLPSPPLSQTFALLDDAFVANKSIVQNLYSINEWDKEFGHEKKLYICKRISICCLAYLEFINIKMSNFSELNQF